MSNMLINPKVRGFVCVNAHPRGCYHEVAQQVATVQALPKLATPKNILVIGGSTGYGLASRIVPTVAGGANTISVAFEREPGDSRTASAGWYNDASFIALAQQHNSYAFSINQDAFAKDTKARVGDIIMNKLGQIDLLIYSIAAPRRTDPVTGITYNSLIKPTGKDFVSKTLDIVSRTVKNVNLSAASDAEIADTIAVMGGADWQLWIDYLLQHNLLAPGFKTLAYSYIGPEFTYPIYKHGTIGRAKEHLLQTSQLLNQQLAEHCQGSASIAVNKAIATQASAAIPTVSLYVAILYKVMKEQQVHENAVQQIYRLFRDYLSGPIMGPVDELGQFRLDNLELRADIQQQVSDNFVQINTDNLTALADVDGYINDFYNLFGFNIPSIDYEIAVDPAVVG